MEVGTRRIVHCNVTARKLSEFDGVQSSIRRNDEVIRMYHPALPKMLSVANAFKISDHQYNPR